MPSGSSTSNATRTVVAPGASGLDVPSSGASVAPPKGPEIERRATCGRRAPAMQMNGMAELITIKHYW
jgi:hypothetical protein